MTDYREVQDYLFGLKAKGIKYGIDRMRGLAEALGHPERQLPILHIAGTNGKGSTAAMLDAILRQAGYRVGLYTSRGAVRGRDCGLHAGVETHRRGIGCWG